MAIFTTKDYTKANAVTRDGFFTADDVMATVILANAYGENLKVYRTSKLPKDLSDDVFVYGIGNGKYDYHQLGRDGIRYYDKIKYASSGIFWGEFGRDILSRKGITIKEDMESLWFMVECFLIDGIDAAVHKQIPKVKFIRQPLTIAKAIELYNLAWDEGEDNDKDFEKACVFANFILNSVIDTMILRSNPYIFATTNVICPEDAFIEAISRLVPVKYHVSEAPLSSKRPSEIKISDVGINWAKLGKDAICFFAFHNFTDVSSEAIDYAWECVDSHIIQGIDAENNYQMPCFSLPWQPMTINSFLLSYYHTVEGADDHSAFELAICMVEAILSNAIRHALAIAKAKSIVDDAIKEAKDSVMVLNEPNIPWRMFLLNSNEEAAKNIAFVVLPSPDGLRFDWFCVPKKSGSKEVRKQVPKEWRGLPKKKLKAVSGVETASYCNRSGLKGGADSLSGAIKMAEIAMSF